MDRSRQKSLFDVETPGPMTLVPIAARDAPLTKAQQNFNRLIGQIGQQREALAQWQAFELRHHQRLAKEMAPLQRELQAGQRQMVRVIDGLLSQAGSGKAQSLGRNQRSQLARLMLELIEAVLATGADDEMEALFDKHSSVSRDELRREELEVTEAFLGDLLGEQALQGHAAKDADELLAHAQQKMQARATQEEQSRAAKREARAAKRGRPTASDQAHDKRQQAAKEASQSVREVYRKLASALHPDRSADSADHDRRTALMKRVNQAYDGNDLLGLLSIQIEIEQIDPEHMANISGERLVHYNQVLREQLAQLQAEVQSLVAPYAFMLELSPGDVKITPVMVEQALRRDLVDINQTLAELRADLAAFQDPRQLRQRLKEMQRDDRAAEAEEIGMIDDFAQLMSAFESAAEPGPRRGRRRR